MLSNRPINSGTLISLPKLSISSTAIHGSVTSLIATNCLRRPRASTNEVPSDRNCHCCISGLVNECRLSSGRGHVVSSGLRNIPSRAGDMLEGTKLILSRLANYTTISAAPTSDRTIVHHIRLIPVNAGATVIIVLASSNVLGDHIYEAGSRVALSVIRAFCGVAGRRFVNGPTTDLDVTGVRAITLSLNSGSFTVAPLLMALTSLTTLARRARLLLRNRSGLLGCHRFRSGTCRLVRFLHHSRPLSRIFGGCARGGKARSAPGILVNHRGLFHRLRGSDVVFNRCGINNESDNAVKVVNPAELSCDHLVPDLGCLASVIDEVLSRGVSS